MRHSSLRKAVVVVAASVAALPLAASLAVTDGAGASTLHRSGSRGQQVRAERSKEFGVILADRSGMTLYLLTGESRGHLECTKGCLGIWPPLLADGRPSAGRGVRASLLGTIPRGQSRQVTYDGHPLYLYEGDSTRGQVNGEGIKSFGGVWYAVGPSGRAVTKPSRAAGSST